MIFEQDVFEYLIHLVAKGYSKETVRWRKSPLLQLLRYLHARKVRAMEAITREILEEYTIGLKEGRFTPRKKSLSEGTYRDHMIALRDFFGWLKDAGRIIASPMPMEPETRPRKPLRLPQVLSPEETVKVLESFSPATALGLRDRAMLELLYSTGIRKRELVNLNLEDFSCESHELLILDGKGKKDRVVPVGEHACRFTDAYIRLVRPWQVKDEREKALFVQHHSGSRLALRTVAQIVERAVDRSGVEKRVTPHTFRHTMATHLLRNHADLRHIQAILGHKSLESTQIYTHVSLEDLKEVVRKAHPHGRRRNERHSA